MKIGFLRKHKKGDKVLLNPECFAIGSAGENFKKGKVFTVINVHYDYTHDELLYELDGFGSYLGDDEIIKTN